MSGRQWSLGIALAIATALGSGASAWASDAAATSGTGTEAESGTAGVDGSDFLLAPVGAGPIVSTAPMGTNGKGLPVPLPELVDPEPAKPSLMLDRGREAVDPGSVLGVPARDVRPVIVPES